MTPGAVEAFRRPWAIATLAGAVVVTVIDAALLQRSKSYFTGGFLSVDYLDGWVDVALFVGTSLLVDGAFVGLVTGVVVWALSRSRLSAEASVLAGAIAGIAPLLVADVFSYQILQYLGDAFDFGLMLDLTGGNIFELLAVSSTHLVGVGLLALAAGGAAGGLIWAANRYWGPRATAALPARTLVMPLAFALAGCVSLTAAANASDSLENGLLRKPAARVFASLINIVSDVDRDRFGVVGRTTDPDPFDGSVFPYAADIPGNGIDEDGIAGDLPREAGTLEQPVLPTTGWQRRPDVVLIVLESFRADLVGARLNGKPITPVIDAVAARGVSLDAAFSHNGYTVQSRHHLFTGSLLAVPARTTLVDDFLANGYRVGYFSAQDESFGGQAYDVGFTRATVSSDSRMDRARRYSPSTTPGSLVIPATVVQERLQGFLQTYGSGPAPLFVYVNFQETHFPYSHPGVETLISPVRLDRGSIAPANREALWDTYANTAAYVDRAIGQVLEAMRQARGVEPGIVITADHGESLFDEGFLGHGYALNDVQTRVPLVVANLPMRLEEPFGQKDLRGALGAALQQPPAVPGVPTVRSVSGRAVFQYLGDLSRPRQIAFLQDGKRLVYDFRSRRVGRRDSGWSPPSDLPDVELNAFLTLVHLWEAMNLAHRGPLPIQEQRPAARVLP